MVVGKVVVHLCLTLIIRRKKLTMINGEGTWLCLNTNYQRIEM